MLDLGPIYERHEQIANAGVIGKSQAESLLNDIAALVKEVERLRDAGKVMVEANDKHFNSAKDWQGEAERFRQKSEAYHKALERISRLPRIDTCGYKKGAWAARYAQAAMENDQEELKRLTGAWY